MSVVTRFPPSPTGELHLGGARTALFNWLYARGRDGKFILRIEDTDQARNSEEATVGILQAMEWLGLDWDEGPYYQSKRFDRYREVIQDLVDQGKAYYCHCTPETLKTKRDAAMAAKAKPMYDLTCRDKNLGPAEGAVVRLKTPLDGVTVYEDAILGSVSWQNNEMDDLVILRSDNTPTYHLACVVDDVDMGMTHIIRGQDHVNNTPRQILIYQAMGAELPVFAHVPMIHGQDGGKLSKRHGATSVMVYKDMGYLPEAMVNYLVRLGWSYGDQELFGIEELIEKFNLEHIGRSPSVFNQEKLDWLNAQYIMAADNDRLAADLAPLFVDRGMAIEPDRIAPILDMFKPRAKTLIDLVDQAAFLFSPITEYDPKGDKKVFKPQAAELLEPFIERLAEVEFTEEALENLVKSFAEEKEIKLGLIAQPIRLALTGRTASPGLFEIMVPLGREEVTKRLKAAMDYIRSKEA